MSSNKPAVKRAVRSKMRDTIELPIWKQQQDLTAASFNAMRKNKLLTDVMITCDGTEIAAHRTLLCAASPYFAAMFKLEYQESLSGKLEFPTIPIETAQMIVDFIYTGQIPNIVGDRYKLKSLVEACHLLQINLLFQYSWKLLSSTLYTTYFLELWQMAELYGDKDLQSKIVSYVAKHYFETSSTTEFSNLTVSQLIRVISNPGIDAWATDIILDGIMSWVKFCREDRQGQFDRLLQHVDMKKISAIFLKTCWEDSLFKGNSFPMSPVSKEISYRFVDPYCEPKLLCVILADRNFLTVYNLKTLSWDPCIVLPASLKLDDEMTAVAFHGNLYFIGSEGPDGESSRVVVYKYCISAEIYVRLVDLKLAVSNAGAAVLDSCIYIVGGDLTAHKNAVQRLNTVKHTTEVLACTRFSHTIPSVFAFQNNIYVVGSCNATEKAVEKYDSTTDQWTVITEIPGEINWCCGSLCCEKLFLFPNLNRELDSGMYIFDFASAKWDTAVQEDGPKRAYGIWATWAHSLAVLDRDGSIHIYDIDEKKWMPGGAENLRLSSPNLTTLLN